MGEGCVVGKVWGAGGGGNGGGDEEVGRAWLGSVGRRGMVWRLLGMRDKEEILL